MSDKTSNRATALEAIVEASASSERLIPSDSWEHLVNIAWDNQAAPGDRRAIRAQIVAILDQVAMQMPEEFDEDN